MQVTTKQVKIRDIVAGYSDNEHGVTGMNGKLDIRPKYQREFVYDSGKQKAVIKSVFNGFPLNSIYWVKRDDDSYEVLDGQQRTISICRYFKDDFSIEKKARTFDNLEDTEQNQFLDYVLNVYICEGNEKEILDWFRVINIAGEKLADQEMRNALYTGKWLTSAKENFSKANSLAVEDDIIRLLSGDMKRQKYLETAIQWIIDGQPKVKDEDSIAKYMGDNKNKDNANELVEHFKSVIDWTNQTFPDYNKKMKGVNWGYLYREYGAEKPHIGELGERVEALMADGEIKNQAGIYTFVFSGDERDLNLRAFSDAQKTTAYSKQKGICTICKQKFKFDEMQGDHIMPWSKGGKTNSENLQMLCRQCNGHKSNK